MGTDDILNELKQWIYDEIRDARKRVAELMDGDFETGFSVRDHNNNSYWAGVGTCEALHDVKTRIAMLEFQSRMDAKNGTSNSK